MSAQKNESVTRLRVAVWHDRKLRRESRERNLCAGGSRQTDSSASQCVVNEEIGLLYTEMFVSGMPCRSRSRRRRQNKLHMRYAGSEDGLRA